MLEPNTVPPVAPRAEDAVQRVITAVTELIAQRRLVPGQQLRQEELGQRLGLSRGPVREALKALSAQQVVRHERHRGYFVAQFGAADMQQLYRLRAFAEAELLRSVRAPAPEDIVALQELNARMAEPHGLHALWEDNDAFHRRIFGLSPLRVMFDETRRWWAMTGAYRGLSLSVGAREHVIADHAALIAALQDGDREALVTISDRHRARSFTNLLPLLPPD